MTHYGFKFCNALPSRFAKLTLSLVVGLYDATVKYGHDVSGVAVRRLAVELPGGRAMHLSAVVPNRPEHKRNLVVSHELGMLQSAGTDVIIIDERNSFLAVEAGFGLLDLQIALRIIDDMMEEVGAFDRRFGERKRVIHDLLQSASSLRVGELFTDPLHVLRLVLTGQSDDEVLVMFDHPDQVEVISNDGQTAEVTSKRGFRAMADATTQVMSEFGISDMSEFDDLAEEDKGAFQARFFEEVQKRLAPAD